MSPLLFLCCCCFLVVLFLSVTSPAFAVTAPSDVAALAAFKAAVTPSSISSWSCLATWDFTSGDPCAVPRRSHFICGITCSSAAATYSHVTAITLDPAGYSGKLTTSLSNLTALTHLDLSGNNFHGPITDAAFSSLSSLQTLTLSSNSFSGYLPPLLFLNLTSLVSLDLSHNAISGKVPNNLSRLTSLRTVDLSFNNLTGELPGALPPNLVELALRQNSLSGALPRAIFEPMRYLEVLELAGNGFSGGVETWLLQLPSLQQLDLANNSLTGLDVVGFEREEKQSLVVAVDLGFNKIEGFLPPELAQVARFPALAALSLRHNRLKGRIPEEYRRFRRLFLDGNFLNGKVPKGFFGDMAGSIGDNCLNGCPTTMPLCAPEQKPHSVCKQAYGGAAAFSSSSTLFPPLM